MSNQSTSTRMSPVSENALNVAVPLAVIAILCTLSGASIGSWSAIGAAVVAAILTTLFQFFGAGVIHRLSGDAGHGVRFFVLAAAFNAALTAVAMVIVSALGGF